MMYHHFTSTELATEILELGYQARIAKPDGQTNIESSSSGTKWTVHLYGQEPFFDSMYISMLAWVKGNPYEWCSKWNSERCWSTAHAVLQENGVPTPDEDGDYMIVISYAYDFEGGVSNSYLALAFQTWSATVDEVVLRNDTRTLAAYRTT